MKFNIVLVPFPFDDLSGLKVRPAVCLTHEIGTYKHVVIAFITSQAALASEPSERLISAQDHDFSKTGLKVTSAIRLHRLLTIPTALIKRKLGALPLHYQAVLENKLRALFGL